MEKYFQILWLTKKKHYLSLGKFEIILKKKPVYNKVYAFIASKSWQRRIHGDVVCNEKKRNQTNNVNQNMKWLRNNIYWLSFLSVFILGFGLILTYCYFTNNFTLKSIKLADWLRYFAGSGTVGGFWYLILDKILNGSRMKHLEWQDRIPFISIGSPCSPLASYCDINILDYYDDKSGRGNEYFRVSNLGKITAYNLKFKFCTSNDFIDSNIFNRHYIPYLPPYFYSSYEGFTEGIFSNYNVNPDTKEVSNREFKICNCLENCEVSKSSNNEKRFYIQVEYSSSINEKYGHKMKSSFQVDVICSKIKLPPPPIEAKLVDEELETEVQTERDCVYIKGIQLLEYKYE